MTPRRELGFLFLHYAALLAAQAAYACLYVSSPWLKTALFVPQLFRLAYWTAPVILLLIWARLPPLDYLKLRHNVGRGAAWGVAIGGLILAGNVVVHYLQTGGWRFNLDLGLHRWLGPVLLIGLSEDVVFRGWFLQKFLDHMSFAKANLLQAALFLLIHVPGWILLGQFRRPGVIPMMVSITVFALIAGWLLRRTRSLWACMIAHSFNNLASSI
jgi:uncharacterized protein